MSLIDEDEMECEYCGHIGMMFNGDKYSSNFCLFFKKRFQSLIKLATRSNKKTGNIRTNRHIQQLK